jgi:hypothetical protein
MSIAIACPSCGSTYQVPDTAAGAQGKCRGCGAVVHVPAKSAKVCTSCGMDVSHQPRTKDEQGHYYCNPCWTALASNAAQSADGESFSCPDCGSVIGIDQMDASGVCIRCAIDHSRPRSPLKSEHKGSRLPNGRRQEPKRLESATRFAYPLVYITLALALLGGGAWLVLKPRTDNGTSNVRAAATATVPSVQAQVASVANQPTPAPTAEEIKPDPVDSLRQQLSSEQLKSDALLISLREIAGLNRADAQPLILQLQSRLSRGRIWTTTHQITIQPGWADVHISPNGQYVLYSATSRGEMDVLDMNTGETRRFGRRAQLAFVGSDRVVVPMYFDLIYRRVDTGAEVAKAKLPIEENASFEYGWIAASPSGRLVARFGPVSRGMLREKGYGKPIFVMDTANGATAALLDGGDAGIGCFAPIGPATLVSAGEAEMSVWDLSKSGGQLLHQIDPNTRSARSNQVTVPWIGISYGRDVSIYPWRSGAIESYSIDTGKLTRRVDVSDFEAAHGMTPDGSQFLMARMSRSSSTPEDRTTFEFVVLDAESKQERVLEGVWKNGAMSLNGRTIALAGKDRIAVMQSRDVDAWQAEADRLCSAYLLKRWGDSDAAMLADASAGHGDIAATNRMEQVAYDQKQQADREAAAIAQANHDAEFGAGRPRAVASALIEKAKQQGKLRDAKFVNYFESGGFHQWDKLPSGVNEVGCRFSFEFVTQAGLVRIHEGYIMFRQRSGQWEPFVINVDGMGDIPVKVFIEGGFIIR